MSTIDIYIRDKDLGIVRRVGDNQHDMLTINEQGQLRYCNLQNGGWCRTGEEPNDWYEFVPNEDVYGYNIDPNVYGYNIDPREDGEDE